jgi:hypothetical protein
VEVGAASISGVRIVVHNEKAADSRIVAVVEGAVGKEELARHDGVGFGVKKSLAPAFRGFDEQRA